MAIPSDFVASWKFIHPKDIVEMLNAPDRPKASGVLILRNEIPPADLYVYFAARFGAPNGIQNFLRRNDSDNLVHWEWAFRTSTGMVMFQELNFRTEVWFFGGEPVEAGDIAILTSQVKMDFSNYGRKMSEVRKSLEDWTEFVNPYRRLASAVENMVQEIDQLELRPEDQALPDINSAEQFFPDLWGDIADRYSKGLGLCFGVRSMLPVMAESYVNLLLFVLMRPEIKMDERLKEHTIRQPIDIRVKTLHMNCIGFEKAINYGDEACKQYHSLVNERNDLLHGNVVLEKLKFNEVYFNGTVPIFKQYRSMWERTIGVDVKAVGLQRLKNEIKVVEGFVRYLNSCLKPNVQKQMERIARTRDLGFNKKTGRIGILFAHHMVDFFPSFDNDDGQSPNIHVCASSDAGAARPPAPTSTVSKGDNERS
ncbi:hypothetical protein L602_003400000020 [Cupriavidus gilardii J11]|uniref:Uncharacterized protein n=1 Tax=Cupriavidus gilardii J11 TaxID=936133 RepID=A0A562BCG1_9BURK|nr:hypothetical protein [Cupriavidus gilardii]TWG82718.1 hypothetical protein L602_003400000020 [Cupriavidus gilardii J11]